MKRICVFRCIMTELYTYIPPKLIIMKTFCFCCTADVRNSRALHAVLGRVAAVEAPAAGTGARTHGGGQGTPKGTRRRSDQEGSVNDERESGSKSFALALERFPTLRVALQWDAGESCWQTAPLEEGGARVDRLAVEVVSLSRSDDDEPTIVDLRGRWLRRRKGEAAKFVPFLLTAIPGSAAD